MARISCTRAGLLALACLLASFSVAAQTSILEKLESVFDGLANTFDLIGQKSEELVGPSLDLPSNFDATDFTGLVSVIRKYDESFPVPMGGTVSLSNEFGGIAVQTWDSQVVRVQAEIRAGAQRHDDARDVTEAVTINVSNSQGVLAVRTLLPDLRSQGEIPIEVNYLLTVPQNAALVIGNYFGDTSIDGVGAAVALRTRYGKVYLKDIGGPVEVQAVGDFPLVAKGLAQGGQFVLRGSRAVFERVAGPLTVGNYMGAVYVRDLDAESSVEIISEASPVHVYLDAKHDPAIDITGHFATLQSQFDLDRRIRGDLLVARRHRPATRQTIDLHAAHSEVFIHEQGAPAVTAAAAKQDLHAVKDVVMVTEALSEGQTIAIEGIVGDLHVKGADTDEVSVTATKIVRVESTQSARAALDALALRIEPVETGLLVRNVVTEDMSALGCQTYRVDLLVTCPRVVALTIHDGAGYTLIEGMGGQVDIQQKTGTVAVEHSKGPLDITNHDGTVKVRDCAGPVSLRAMYGDIEARTVFGKLTVNCDQGRTVIETPGSAVFARSRQGDIRLIALDDVKGNYDLRADDGNLSVVLPPEPDAALFATAENGEVRSRIPLVGSIHNDSRKFNAHLKNGTYNISLETRGGDIRID